MENSWYRFNRIEISILGGAIAGACFGFLHYLYLFFGVASRGAAFLSILLALFSLLCLVGGCMAFRLVSFSGLLFVPGAAAVFILYAITPVPEWIPGDSVFWIHTAALPLSMILFGLPKVRHILKSEYEENLEEASPGEKLEMPRPVSTVKMFIFLITGVLLFLGLQNFSPSYPGNPELVRKYRNAHQDLTLLHSLIQSDPQLQNHSALRPDVIKTQLYRQLESLKQRKALEDASTSDSLPPLPDLNDQGVPLDPWNTPYVIQIGGELETSTGATSSGSLVIYSAGPNRKDDEATGDDVYITYLDRLLNRFMISSNP